jgi:hypothetical protein
MSLIENVQDIMSSLEDGTVSENSTLNVQNMRLHIQHSDVQLPGRNINKRLVTNFQATSSSSSSPYKMNLHSCSACGSQRVASKVETSASRTPTIKATSSTGASFGRNMSSASSSSSSSSSEEIGSQFSTTSKTSKQTIWEETTGHAGTLPEEKTISGAWVVAVVSIVALGALLMTTTRETFWAVLGSEFATRLPVLVGMLNDEMKTW